MPIYEWECTECGETRTALELLIVLKPRSLGCSKSVVEGPRFCNVCKTWTMKKTPSIPGGRYRFNDRTS